MSTLPTLPSLDSIDPYHLAYLFRRQLERDPAGFAVEPTTAIRLFEALDEDDALRMQDTLEPHLGHEGVLRCLAAVQAADTRPRVRAAAVLAMGRHPSGTAREAVLASLRRDPSPRVRAACLAAWSRLEENLPVNLLRPFFTDEDARVRANAVEAVVDREVRGVIPVLEVLVEDPSPRVAAAAALGLWRNGRIDLLRLFDRAEGEADRTPLVWALARAGRDPRVLERLESAFLSTSARERRMAAYGLPSASPAARLPALVRRALAHPETEVRDALVDGCRRVSPEQTGTALEAVLAGSGGRTPVPGDETGERQVANALSCLRRGGAEIRFALVAPLLVAADTRIRANAIELVETRTELPGVTPLLARALHEGAPRVVAQAALALWRRGSPEGMGALVRLARSRDPGSQASAAFGLGRAGGAIAESVLRDMVRGGGEGARRIAMRFLSGGALALPGAAAASAERRAA